MRRARSRSYPSLLLGALFRRREVVLPLSLVLMRRDRTGSFRRLQQSLERLAAAKDGIDDVDEGNSPEGGVVRQQLVDACFLHRG